MMNIADALLNLQVSTNYDCDIHYPHTIPAGSPFLFPTSLGTQSLFRYMHVLTTRQTFGMELACIWGTWHIVIQYFQCFPAKYPTDTADKNQLKMESGASQQGRICKFNRCTCYQQVRRITRLWDEKKIWSGTKTAAVAPCMLLACVADREYGDSLINCCARIRRPVSSLMEIEDCCPVSTLADDIDISTKCNWLNGVERNGGSC